MHSVSSSDPGRTNDTLHIEENEIRYARIPRHAAAHRLLDSPQAYAVDELRQLAWNRETRDGTALWRAIRRIQPLPRAYPPIPIVLALQKLNEVGPR